VSKSNYEELLLQFEETIRNQKSYFNYICAKQKLGISYDQWLVLEQGIINFLEKKELIIKVNNEKNKRANKIYLTHQGYDSCEKISKVYADCLQKQFKGIYEREVSLIREILKRVNQNKLK